MINEYIEELYEADIDARFLMPKFKLNYTTIRGVLLNHIVNNKKFHYQLKYIQSEKSGLKDLAVPEDFELSELENLAEIIIFDTDKINEKNKLMLRLYTKDEQTALVWLPNEGKWLALGTKKNKYSRFRQLSEGIFELERENSDCSEATKGLIIQYWREKFEISLKRYSDGYLRYLSDTMKPFVVYLDAEQEMIFNDEYAIFSEYFFTDLSELGDKSSFLDENSGKPYALLILENPPRSFLKANTWFICFSKEKEKLDRAKMIEHFELDEGFGFVFYKEDIDKWPNNGYLRIAPNAHSNKLRRRAVRKLQRPTSIHVQKLADIISRSEGYPTVSRTPVVTVSNLFSRDAKENWKQCSAIDLAIATEDIALIMGPPGTGKTEIICEIIRQVVRKNGRILMTAPTHVAVDNVLERIFDEKEIEAVRVGRRIDDISPELQKLMLFNKEKQWKNKTLALKEKLEASNTSKNELELMQSEFFDELENENKITIKQSIVDQCNVVCGTLLGISNFEFSRSTEEKPFDLVIVDEASKAALIDFLVPAVRARKWLLIGDHRQLPPYINRNELKYFIDQYIRINDKAKKGNDNQFVRQIEGERRFSPKVEDISWRLTRFFEENHNLEDYNQRRFLFEVVKKLEGDKKTIKYLLDMLEYALGSCFHYFWRRVDDSRKAYLPIQYRMPTEIAEFLSNNIYKNQDFYTSKNVKDNGFQIKIDSKIFSKDIIKNPITWISTSNLKMKKRKERNPPKKIRGLWFNSTEAEIISKLIKQIIDSYPLKLREGNRFNFDKITNENPLTIGVITFYSRQAREIRFMLNKLDFLKRATGGRYKVEGLPISIRVSIVDRFQGQEQDIIILSMTRSNHENKIGFLSNLQRLNVGLSRAKHNLIVVGDHEFFKKLPKRKENILVKNLAWYCKNNLIHYNAIKDTSQTKKTQKNSIKKKGGDK